MRPLFRSFVACALCVALNTHCLTLAGLGIGASLPRPIESPEGGLVTGFVADLYAAAKIGGSTGAAYGALVILFPVVVILLLRGHRGGHGDIEYPVFPRTAEGRVLQTYIGTRKTVALIVEKPPSLEWQSIFGTDGFLKILPKKVFEAADKEAYYRLIDSERRRGAVNFPNNLEGVRLERAALSRTLSAEMLWYVRFGRPVTSCAVEARVDKVACGAAMISAASGGNAGTGCAERPTGVRILRLPIEATLIRPDTSDVLTAKGDGLEIDARIYGAIGNTQCPAVLDAFDEALSHAISYVKDRQSPMVKTAMIKFLTKDKNSQVAELLAEGLEEVQGETPDFHRAAKHWEKALELSKGQSEGALANLGSYYFSIGEFTKAAEYYDRAMKVPGSDKSYWREMKKRMEAMNDVPGRR